MEPGPLPGLLLGLAVTAMGLTGALHALMTKDDSKSALAWVAFCLVIPVAGPLVYLVFGINRVAGAARGSYQPRSPDDSSETIAEPAGTRLRPLSMVGESLTGEGLRSCDEIRLLENGESLFPMMLEDIAGARERIRLSTYIFQDDGTGERFLRALTAARDRGVDVRVIVDGLGGTVYRPAITRRLERSGLNFRRFNPLSLFPPSLHANMRNHRKIMAVDGRCAYFGGQNIGDRHLVRKPDNPKRARDLHFRATGKIADDLERAFLRDWSHCAGETVPFAPANRNRPDAAVWSRLILDGPNENLNRLNDLLAGVFAAARRRIWIMTPYFLPSADLAGALNAARLRGVDVKIMLPERANVHLAHWAAQHNLRHILARRLEVRLQPPPFIHTKAILIDGNYTLTGSFNLDPRSLRLNFELGVEVFSADFAGELEAYFRAALGQARRLDAAQLRARPGWMRVRDAVAWLFSPYL